MPLEPSVYVTWKDLWGELPGKEHVTQGLQKLDRLHTLILLSRINTHLFLDNFHRNRKETVEVQRFLLAWLLSSEVIEKAQERFGGDRLDFRRPFHQQQVLTLMKWALQETAQVGGIRPDTDATARHRLGSCLIKTSDLLFPPEMHRAIDKWRQSSTINNFLAIQLSSGSGFEVNNPPAIPSSMVRSDILFTDIVQANINTPLDVHAEFEKHTGLALTTYLDMIFALMAHYVSRTQQQLQQHPGNAVINPKTFFGPHVGQDQAQRFWAMEAASVEQVAAELEKDTGLSPHQDFTAFRMKPFLRIADDCAICVNPTFLQEKLEAGLFWAITNHLQKTEDRKLMFDTWGKCFEAYVNHLLSSAAHKDLEVHLPFPQFEEKGHRHESFDAVLISGQTLAVVECKGGFLSAKAKYSEDRKALLEELDLKFGSQPGGGVEQLVRKIEQVFHARDSERRQINELDPYKIQVVIPVLIVQDGFVSSPFTVPWLAKLFRDCIRKKALLKKLVCMGLVVVDVGELEAIRPHVISKQVSLIEALMHRARKGAPGSDNRIFTFHDTTISLLEEKKIDKVPRVDFDERLDAIVNRVCWRFFDRPFERLGSEEESAHG